MSSEKPRLIFIHGINNEGNSAESIRKDWGDALNQGLSNAGLGPISLDSIECAFYGDLLYEGTKKWKEARKQRLVQEQSSPAPRSDPFDATAHSEIEIHPDKYKQMESELIEVYSPKTVFSMENDSKIQFNQQDGASDERSIRSLDLAGVETVRAAGPHKSVLIKGAKLLESVSPSLVKKLVGVFLDQAIAYLEDKELHQQINNQVIDQLFSDKTKKDQPHVVVTHSNGTILSYLLFSDRLKDWNIKAYYTIGSPLGAKTMQSYLPEPRDAYPGKVSAWYNCWDPEDFVSYNTGLFKDTIGIDGIINVNTFDTDEKDKHSIVSYLSHAMLARLIHHDFAN